MNIPARWLLWLALILSQQVLGADDLRLGAAGSNPLKGSGAGEFLPVEEAYQLQARREGKVLYLDWNIAPGYYLYRERFAASLAGTGGENKPLPLDFMPGVTRYDDYYEKELEVYYDSTTVTVSLDGGAEDGYLRVESQGCADAGLCYPPRTLFIDLDAASGVLPVLETLPEDVQPPSAPALGGTPLLLVLGFALVGGLILNLMPCVFPVLSIKVLSLSQHHFSSRGRHIHGLVYSGGVIVCFLIIAGVLIALRAGGEALGWGFQLQSPGFITALIFLFFLMGLSFSGFFQPGTRLMSLGQSSAAGNSLTHSFLAGVLATVVASPCTAPFMGTALGFALTQDTATALLVFGFLGLGMALPFLLLTWAPALLDRIPRPGPWMENLKEFLAFPLYLTAVWLVWILGKQTDISVVALVLCGLILVALAVWFGRRASRPAKLTGAALFAVALLLPATALYSEPEPPLWEPYSPRRLDQLLAERQAVFINLTADWCITCLANEKVALDSEAFRQLLQQRNITYLKGDWTNRDEDITALLAANGRTGVPLYLFYPAGRAEPEVLPQILSPAIVRRALTAN